MASTFYERIDHLSDSVGTGEIVAGCTVNQPYAQNQHQSVWFEHPHGGRALYLGGPLFEDQAFLLREIATGVVTAYGSSLKERMIYIAETLARYVAVNAPVETGQLRLSGNPWVEDKGVRIYDRPALAPREAD